MGFKVSIIIPIDSNVDSLNESVDSVLGQTYDNIEVLVINTDVNNDHTKEILKSYGNKIRYFERSEDSIATAIEFGLGKITGKYFSWLLIGNEYHPDKIKKQIEKTKSHKNTVVVSDWVIRDKNHKSVKTHIVDDIIKKYPSCLFAFNEKIRINTCSLLIPSNLSKSIIFNKSLPVTQDIDLLNRLTLAGAIFKTVHQPLLCSLSNPQFNSLIDSPREIMDFIYSDIIKTTQYSDISVFFGDKEKTVEAYKDILEHGLPRSAAFLMSKIISDYVAVDDLKTAKSIMLNDLSGLTEEKIATDVDILFSKITVPSKKKRIMFSSAHWLTGGMERVMSSLFKELKDDYDIFLITPYDERGSCISVPDYVTSVKISDELFMYHFDSLILSYALLFKVDVIIGFINLFGKQSNLYRLCADTGIKTIASNHEYYFYPYKSYPHYGVVEKRLNGFANCDAVIWPNNFNAALCGMYVENSYVIGNPNTFEITKNRENISNNKVILCVGRFNDYVKRVDRLLECFSLVLRQTPAARLVLVGKFDNDVPLDQIGGITVNELIRKLNIPKSSYEFIGEVDNLQDYYSKASVLMLTSNSEGFGMVINEAACFGVPTVCNYIPGIEDIVVDGENGFIADQGDLISMAQRVGDILNDKKLHTRLSNNALGKVEKYDSKHIGDKWRYLINSLIDIKDKKSLHSKLHDDIGYKIADSQLFSNILARELNDIFYMAIDSHNKNLITKLSIIKKIRRLPNRLRTSIEYEGWVRTVNKITGKIYSKVKNKLKI